jgi:hypothetical protein
MGFVAALKRMFRDEAMEEVAAALGLAWVTCPIPMYSNDPSRPISWWQGKTGGDMLGIRRIGGASLLWVGGVDECTRFALERRKPGGTAPEARRLERYYGGRKNPVTERFLGANYSGRDDFPLLRHPAFVAGLPRLSSLVESVSVLATAIEARLRWQEVTPTVIRSDVRTLSTLLAAVRESDPPLVRAIGRGDAAAAMTLIRGGTDLGAATLAGVTALDAAAAGGHVELVRALLDAGAAPGPEGRALHLAAGCGRIDVVRLLLDRDIPVDSRDGWGTTPLMAAAHGGHPAIVRLLLERGAEVAAKNRDGVTALAWTSSPEVARMLRAEGAEG